MVQRFYEPEMQAHFAGSRIFRGGTWAVVEGHPDITGKHRGDIWNPRFRHSVSRDWANPGLGFRCAQSERPRFLKSQP